MPPELWCFEKDAVSLCVLPVTLSEMEEQKMRQTQVINVWLCVFHCEFSSLNPSSILPLKQHLVDLRTSVFVFVHLLFINRINTLEVIQTCCTWTHYHERNLTKEHFEH